MASAVNVGTANAEGFPLPSALQPERDGRLCERLRRTVSATRCQPAGCTKHSSEGRPFLPSGGNDCEACSAWVWATRPGFAPEKLLRTPTPALQNGGLAPRRRAQLGGSSAGGQPAAKPPIPLPRGFFLCEALFPPG